MSPLQPWSTHVTATVTLKLSEEPSSVMTYQACRPPQFPAGFNGAENRKNKPTELVPLKTLSSAPCQLVSLILPALLLPLSLCLFSPWLNSPASFYLNAGHCPHIYRLFVSFHPLIKRKGQCVLRKRLPLLQTDQQRRHRATRNGKWMIGLVVLCCWVWLVQLKTGKKRKADQDSKKKRSKTNFPRC